ncbi:MAG: membrane protein insertase YidC [Pararhizobium sp.]
MDNNRNYIVAIALSVLVLVAWQYFYVSPRIAQEQASKKTAAQHEQTTTAPKPAAAPADGAATTQASNQSLPASNESSAKEAGVSRADAIASSKRVAIETPAVSGSINLTGARLDDLKLNDYHVTVDKKSPRITLLSPSSTNIGYFAELGYLGDAKTGTVPGPDTQWSLTKGSKLTPSTPVTLSWTNDKGITFDRTISVDDHYMFTVTDAIRNASGEPVSLTPYGRVTRFFKPVDRSSYLVHEGPIGYFEGTGLKEVKYSSIEDDGIDTEPAATGGWLGMADKYWATAVIPRGDQKFTSRFAYFKDGRPRYQADFKSDPVTIAPGQSATVKDLVFAGAKRVPLVNAYRDNLHIPHFDLLIDWGWFYFITKPMFSLMDFFYQLVGNFGIAIILTTVIVKLIFFPLANKSYASMAKMKRIQPKMQELKERYGDDRMAQQKAMMELYKEEKINPVAGCWPMLLQIPVFFALYKVLYTTIEMRHAPFYGWIRDLSAPDPTSVFNLFGLLPFTPPESLMIGVWPIIMGFTMFLQMRMNPTPPDKTQAMVFTWMPVVFTFMLAHFPAGLVIYYSWNNTLSVIQQSVIMKRQGVKVELWGNLASLFRRKPKPAE